jgi:hypothetical protein
MQSLHFLPMSRTALSGTRLVLKHRGAAFRSTAVPHFYIAVSCLGQGTGHNMIQKS